MHVQLLSDSTTSSDYLNIVSYKMLRSYPRRVQGVLCNASVSEHLILLYFPQLGIMINLNN
jgi:hypothetical protein